MTTEEPAAPTPLLPPSPTLAPVSRRWPRSLQRYPAASDLRHHPPTPTIAPGVRIALAPSARLELTVAFAAMVPVHLPLPAPVSHRVCCDDTPPPLGSGQARLVQADDVEIKPVFCLDFLNPSYFILFYFILFYFILFYFTSLRSQIGTKRDGIWVEIKGSNVRTPKITFLRSPLP